MVIMNERLSMQLWRSSCHTFIASGNSIFTSCPAPPYPLSKWTSTVLRRLWRISHYGAWRTMAVPTTPVWSLIQQKKRNFNVPSSRHSSLTAGITTKLAGEIPDGQTTSIPFPLWRSPTSNHDWANHSQPMSFYDLSPHCEIFRLYTSWILFFVRHTKPLSWCSICGKWITSRSKTSRFPGDWWIIHCPGWTGMSLFDSLLAWGPCHW